MFKTKKYWKKINNKKFLNYKIKKFLFKLIIKLRMKKINNNILN